MSADAIRISAIEASCILGVHAHEREREQPVLVDVELTVDLAAAGRSARIADTVDYERVTDEILALLRFRRYHLLEVAACELAAMLLGVHQGIESLRLRLEKPRALVGRARGAGVALARARGDFTTVREDARFGAVDRLFESAEAGLYLLHIDPGRTIERHLHRVMHEIEWPVAGRVRRDGVEVDAREFTPAQWQPGQVHGYVNDSGRRATLFCCDRPPSLPD